jgi:hypothetical protein
MVLLDHDNDVVRPGERGGDNPGFQLLNGEGATALLADPTVLLAGMHGVLLRVNLSQIGGPGWELRG